MYGREGRGEVRRDGGGGKEGTHPKIPRSTDPLKSHMIHQQRAELLQKLVEQWPLSE